MEAGDWFMYLSTVRMAPLQYGVSLIEAKALSPNPAYTEMVPLLDCRRLLPPTVGGAGIVGQSALGAGGGGGGELELVDVGLWTVNAVVRVDSVELVVGGAELVVGKTLEVVDTEAEVD
jgi:hypothetical protein